MATYKTAQDYMRKHHGFTAKTCWIAHVLADSGKPMRAAPNRGSPTMRVHPCPPDKRKRIAEALSHLGMLGPVPLAVGDLAT